MNLKNKRIIHFEGQKHYSKIKDISEGNEKRIRDAKEVRIKQGGENYHKKQCNMIPDEVKKCDGIHMVSRYKKFTLILSSRKEKKETATVRRSLTRGCSSNEI